MFLQPCSCLALSINLIAIILMKMKYSLSLIILTLLLSACDKLPRLDDVLPDKRKEYNRSRALPDLEVPPDLTLEQDDNLEIPGEEEPATLSAYQRQKKRGGLSELELLAKQYPGEQALPVPGLSTQVWPELVSYWQENAYSIDLEDAELGVLETDWRETDAGDIAFRDKFKIFAEPAEDGKNTILFISSERQEKITLGDGNVEWVDEEVDEKREKIVVAEIKKIFYGDEQIIATSNKSSSTSTWTEPTKTQNYSIERAKIATSLDDKIYLTVPEEFSIAWRQTEELLDNGVFFLEDKDPEKGLFSIIYAETEEQEEGFFSKLKFWGDDESNGTPYQLSLTGVGDKTEVVVLNDDGDWVSDSDANSILNVLMDEYNRL